MGRSPCCDKVGLKKGPWTPEEDQKLLAYIEEHGHGSWRALPAKAGLQRCGKSCRLRWTNYLRPDIKRGKFSLQEEQTIIQLHALLGNRWSAIATHLPQRTDNEIKNYWNTHLKKRLAKMGIDPVTHKPKNDTLLTHDGQSKNASNLSHMAQWESARLEAEARLVRESKLRSQSFQRQQLNNMSSAFSPSTSAPAMLLTGSLESPTSTLTLSENGQLAKRIPTSNNNMIEFVGSSSGSSEIKEEGEIELKFFKDEVENSLSFTSTIHDLTVSMEGAWSSAHEPAVQANLVEDGFTNLLLSGEPSLSENAKESDNSGGSDYYEDNKNYWNSILNLVNSSPSHSPLF